MTQPIDVAATVVADNPEIQALPVLVFQADQALAKFDPIQLRLLLLVDKVKTTTFDITTTAGMKTACELRRECINTRVDATKTYETLNAPMLAAQRGMRQLVKDIESVVSPLELCLDAEIKAQEALKEAERKRKAAEEEARVKAIGESIRGIAGLPAQAARRDAKGIAALDQELSALVVDEATFGEFTEEVVELVAHIRNELGEMFVLTAAREAEAERVRLEGLRLEEEGKRRTLLDAQRRSIDSLRSFPLQGLGKDAKGLRLMLKAVTAGDSAKYDPELHEVAEQVEREALAQIETMLSERVAVEAGVADLARREQEAMDARQRDQDAADQRQRDADEAHAKRSQELKRQEDAFEAEKAEAKRVKAEADAKLLAERLAAEARAKELEPKPEPVPVPPVAVAVAKLVKGSKAVAARPTDMAIVTALSVRFAVSMDVAGEWLRNFDVDTVLEAAHFSEIPV